MPIQDPADPAHTLSKTGHRSGQCDIWVSTNGNQYVYRLVGLTVVLSPYDPKTNTVNTKVEYPMSDTPDEEE